MGRKAADGGLMASHAALRHLVAGIKEVLTCFANAPLPRLRGTNTRTVGCKLDCNATKVVEEGQAPCRALIKFGPAASTTVIQQYPHPLAF